MFFRKLLESEQTPVNFSSFYCKVTDVCKLITSIQLTKETKHFNRVYVRGHKYILGPNQSHFSTLEGIDKINNHTSVQAASNTFQPAKNSI